MRITINESAFFKKLLTKVFDSPQIFITENIQNAQRSGAKRISIEFLDNRDAIFIDNGEGCDDFTRLLIHSTSGWDGTSDEHEGANGEGFFANVACYERIRVESNGRWLEICREEILNGNLESAITEGDLIVNVKGFRLYCYGATHKIDVVDLHSHAMSAGKYVKPNVIVNGKPARKKKTIPPNNSQFAINMRHPDFTGWIYPRNYSPGPMTYYQDREVCRHYTSTYVGGEIFIKNGALDPRSPDRKSFIDNHKLSDFRVNLRKYEHKLALKVVREGSDDDHDDFRDLIRILPQSTLRDSLIFREINPIKFTEKEPDVDDPDNYVPEFDSIDGSPNAGGMDFEETTAAAKIRQDLSKIKELEPDSHRGLARFDGKDVCWVSEPELELYETAVTKMRESETIVIVAANSLQVDVLEESKIPHIKSYDSSVETTVKVADSEMQGNDLRLISAIKELEGVIPGISKINFAVGDIEIRRKLNGSDIPTHITVAFYSKGSIYFQRNWDRDAEFTPHWLIGWFLRNTDTLAHELAHAIYGTADYTPQHYEVQIELAEKILCEVANWHDEWKGAYV